MILKPMVGENGVKNIKDFIGIAKDVLCVMDGSMDTEDMEAEFEQENEHYQKELYKWIDDLYYEECFGKVLGG